MFLVAGALVVLSGVITTIFIFAFPSQSLLKLAQSDASLESIQPERKRLVVELIRRAAADSADNNRAAEAIKPLSPALYSVDSFAAEATMRSTVAQLKQAYDADQRYAAAKRKTMNDFREKMTNVDPDYLRDFESRMQQREHLDDVIEATEEKWIANTINLYDYAIANSRDISLRPDGHLSIKNQDVRQSLLQQIDACRALQQDMFLQREKAVDDQRAIQDAL